MIDSRVDVESFTISNSSNTGFAILEGSEISARDGHILRNGIGVNVRGAGFEFDTAFTNVRLTGNGRDLAADEIPIPTAPIDLDLVD